MLVPRLRPALVSVASRVRHLCARNMRCKGWLADVLTPLTRLESLVLDSCDADSSQFTVELTALTSLQLQCGSDHNYEVSDYNGRPPLKRARLHPMHSCITKCVSKSPKDFLSLTKLECDMRAVKDVGYFIFILQFLTEITHLSITNCNSWGQDLLTFRAGLRQCPSLQSLFYCPIKVRKNVPVFPHFPCLTKLHLDGVYAADSTIAEVLQDNTQLRVLDLADCRAYTYGDSDSLCSVIECMQQLHHFNACSVQRPSSVIGNGDFQYIMCPDSFEELVASLPPSLTLLDLGKHAPQEGNEGISQSNAISSTAMNLLSQSLAQLQALHLYDCEQEVSGFHHMKQLTALRKLSVGQCTMSAASTAELLAALTTNLTALDLHDKELNERCMTALRDFRCLYVLTFGTLGTTACLHEQAYNENDQHLTLSPSESEDDDDDDDEDPADTFQRMSLALSVTLRHLNELCSVRLHIPTLQHVQEINNFGDKETMWESVVIDTRLLSSMTA